MVGESLAPFKGKVVIATKFGIQMDQKPWIVPIPGTRKMERLEENLGAADVKLTPEELSNLNDALSKIEILGDRYPAEYANRVGK